jgi:hypothetical protein
MGMNDGECHRQGENGDQCGPDVEEEDEDDERHDDGLLDQCAP